MRIRLALLGGKLLDLDITTGTQANDDEEPLPFGFTAGELHAAPERRDDWTVIPVEAKQR